MDDVIKKLLEAADAVAAHDDLLEGYEVDGQDQPFWCHWCENEYPEIPLYREIEPSALRCKHPKCKMNILRVAIARVQVEALRIKHPTMFTWQSMSEERGE